MTLQLILDISPNGLPYRPSFITPVVLQVIDLRSSLKDHIYFKTPVVTELHSSPQFSKELLYLIVSAPPQILFFCEHFACKNLTSKCNDCGFVQQLIHQATTFLRWKMQQSALSLIIPSILPCSMWTTMASSHFFFFPNMYYHRREYCNYFVSLVWVWYVMYLCGSIPRDRISHKTQCYILIPEHAKAVGELRLPFKSVIQVRAFFCN